MLVLKFGLPDLLDAVFCATRKFATPPFVGALGVIGESSGLASAHCRGTVGTVRSCIPSDATLCGAVLKLYFFVVSPSIAASLSDEDTVSLLPKKWPSVASSSKSAGVMVLVMELLRR